MIDIGTTLRHYKREDIQNAMLKTAIGREVAVRYGDKGFGKRPDALQYPKDILEFAKQRATSFHVSEERWSNVFRLEPGLRPAELDEIRTGWDLVLDIDCPVWEYSRLITHHLILALKKHGIRSVSCKFSGNKGFHIAVPFEAFPDKVGGEETRLWFPDKIKKILYYLADYIDSKENGFAFTKDLLKMDGISTISEKTGIPRDELFVNVCNRCSTVFSDSGNHGKKAVGHANAGQKNGFQCERCEKSLTFEQGKDYCVCKSCGHIQKKEDLSAADETPSSESRCPSCMSYDIGRKASPEALLNLDAMLISPRHMYRMVYSLHEKSGLVSVPVNPDEVLLFEKEMARPDMVEEGRFSFLDITGSDYSEASELFDNALSYDIQAREKEMRSEQFVSVEKQEKRSSEYEELESAIPEEFFPPCIKRTLEGLSDGKKRAMFILINFLSNTGYSWDAIDDIMSRWNEKNKEPLREVLLKGQIRYRKAQAKMQKKKVLPANCDNKMYYKDLRICTPDNFCPRIKNPVNYAVLKSRIASGTGKKGARARLTPEQKEMRRKHRQMQKKQEEDKERDRKQDRKGEPPAA
ncbi:hypothetical protein JXB31_01670 [Candidatus Woesearchaeota archaeon]|nr:hypothetical protein [Candidatus Woesearchaeota archaeon]